MTPTALLLATLFLSDPGQFPPVNGQSRPEQALIVSTAGQVRCAGRVVPVVSMPRSMPRLGWTRDGTTHPNVLYRFGIDETGRTLSIAQHPSPVAYRADDLAPTLAATRFAPGPARADCTVEFTRTTVPLMAAAPDDLIAYSLSSIDGRLPRAVYPRMFGPGSDCVGAPYPGVLMRAYPDFTRLPMKPGVPGWSMVEFDITARGRPVRARTVAGTGEPAFDRASLKAVQASRFTDGARIGCRYPYRQRPGILTAPQMPPPPAERTDSRCPVAWAKPPVLRYPPAYNRRSIEGWAIVAFDVAPWGETGNVRVVASQPTADFGTQAASLVRDARKVASQGGTGCTERVRFRIRPRSEPEAPEPA